jgi:hypothetical protein
MRQLNPGLIVAIAIALAAPSQPTFVKGTKTTRSGGIFIMPNDEFRPVALFPRAAGVASLVRSGRIRWPRTFGGKPCRIADADS